MSLISARLSLLHRCTIQRVDELDTPDSWGQPTSGEWQDHLTDVPCRNWATAGREAVKDGTSVVVVEDVRLVLALGTDVTEQDRIASVTSRGQTIQDGPLGIRAVLTHRDHLELILERLG